jgi:hypothetical protein
MENTLLIKLQYLGFDYSTLPGTKIGAKLDANQDAAVNHPMFNLIF